MQTDNVTLSDLSIFHPDEASSVFHKLDYTQTTGGREWLRRFFCHPLSDIAKIGEIQQVLICISGKATAWPSSISNGTIMVIEKFYESPIDSLPDTPNLVNALSYKFFHAPDYSLVRYTVGHFGDFIRGFLSLAELFDNDDTPPTMRLYIQRAHSLVKHESLLALAATGKTGALTPLQTISFGDYIRNRFKQAALELIDIYSRLEAWYSMARAVNVLNLVYPSFKDGDRPSLQSTGLYHILLPVPVSYTLSLEHTHNFLFLTGANMAGKSTFIKSIGTAVYLAHLGLGVPAQQMELTVFDGILSNINVEDNLARGESYFFNEVQRIKTTINKINNGRKWLVLIDELFKGTNVQDAMTCSGAVIRGLIKIPNSLFILSTHLYEIAEELKIFPNIVFRFFETEVEADQLRFSYQLKDGVSNDRIGYLILKNERVVEMLEKL